MPSTSVVGCGRVSTTTPTAASSTHPVVRRPAAANPPINATDSGPRNSSVTASPRPTRATAE